MSYESNCIESMSKMDFIQSGRNMQEVLTPRQLGVDWPRARAAERESSQLAIARVTNNFSTTRPLSAKFLTTDIHHPSIIRSKTAFEKRSLANVLYQLFRFFLYSRLLRGLILIHNKPVEIWPSPFYPAWKFFTIVQALRGNRIILQMMVSLQFQQV